MVMAVGNRTFMDTTCTRIQYLYYYANCYFNHTPFYKILKHLLINLSFGADVKSALNFWRRAVDRGAPQFYYTIAYANCVVENVQKKILRNFPKPLDKCLAICYNGLNRKGKGKADFPNKEIVGYGM